MVKMIQAFQSSDNVLHLLHNDALDHEVRLELHKALTGIVISASTPEEIVAALIQSGEPLYRVFADRYGPKNQEKK